MHSHHIPLAMASTGSKVRLVSVNGGRAMCSHLAAMGLLPGVEVEVKRNSPGGPFILGIKGGQLILGRGMAQRILVS
ncbi:MAG: ferrous iron transport protein A [Desulfosarcina sp.]|nr:ferrous iron transport protein A [Desulfobacterales bacterium]